MDRVWITWETQRRNEELAEAFEAELRVFDYSHQATVLRYLLSIFRTVPLLFRSRNRIVFAQCPSVVLVVLVSFFRLLGRFTFIIDAHNATFEYLQHPFLRSLMRFALRRADFVIVSNDRLVPKLGIEPSSVLILPDRLPRITEGELPRCFAESPRPIFLLISSFAADEPLEVFLRTIRRREEAFTLFVSGRRERAGSLLEFEDEKIRFTDFLPREEYDALLANSDLAIDLTDRDDCLPCGAYEAVSVGVPLLLSDTPVLRETFSEGCLYVDATDEGINRGLDRYFHSAVELREQMQKFHGQFDLHWQKRFDELGELLRNRYNDSE